MRIIVKGIGIGVVGAVYIWLYGLAGEHQGLFVFGSLMAAIAAATHVRRAAQ
jgi:hypothetical protein